MALVAHGEAPEWGCDAFWKDASAPPNFARCAAVFAVLFAVNSSAAAAAAARGAPPLAAWLRAEPLLGQSAAPADAHNPLAVFDIASLLPADQSHYMYHGSLVLLRPLLAVPCDCNISCFVEHMLCRPRFARFVPSVLRWACRRRHHVQRVYDGTCSRSRCRSVLVLLRPCSQSLRGHLMTQQSRRPSTTTARTIVRCSPATPGHYGFTEKIRGQGGRRYDTKGGEDDSKPGQALHGSCPNHVQRLGLTTLARFNS